MLKIRLRRVGRSKQPLYRVVIAEHTAPRDGRFVEIVGQYDPASKDKNINLNEERIKYWISVGAQPTETVHRILFKQGLYDIDPPKRITVEKKPEAIWKCLTNKNFLLYHRCNVRIFESYNEWCFR